MMMTIVTSWTVLLALCVSLKAQNYTTIPPGLLTQEASHGVQDLGRYPEMRFQLLDSDVLTPMQVLELACRRDGHRDASSAWFAGRSWANVQLVMGERDQSAQAFSLNLASNVTRVFSASVSWPDHSVGPRTSVPHPWATDVVFPFSVPWSYSGKRSGMTVDLTFRGGTLTNSSPWTAEHYLLDGALAAKELWSQGFIVGDTTNPRCMSAWGTPLAVPNVITTAAGQVGVVARILRYPYSTSTLFAFSLGGDSAGVSIGLRCQKYYLGDGPFVFSSFMTPASGYEYYVAGSPGVQYDQSYVGIRIWTQPVFLDGNWKGTLSAAGYSEVLARPLASIKAGCIWAASATSVTGNILSIVPVFRLAHR